MVRGEGCAWPGLMAKIAIVTHKRQTTRNAMTGIAMQGGTQVRSSCLLFFITLKPRVE